MDKKNIAEKIIQLIQDENTTSEEVKSYIRGLVSLNLNIIQIYECIQIARSLASNVSEDFEDEITDYLEWWYYQRK